MCDAKDNDCDGLTDDGLTVYDSSCLQVGVCDPVQVLAYCPAGEWVCSYDKIADYEKGKESSCDALDNDCDGKTDEDFEYQDYNGKKKKGDPCRTGACAGGVVTCRQDKNGLECNTDYKASAEKCNGVDDDCNGQTDEGTDSLCDDKVACTSEKCTAGKCENPILAGYCLINGNVCYASGTVNPMNACETCDPAVSKTTWTARGNGTSCDADANGCTQGDACQTGKCVAGKAVDCSSANDQCNTGQCSSTGSTQYICIKVPVTNGTSCNENDACTKQDKCSNG